MSVLTERIPTTFTTRTARRLGVHPRDLYRWRDTGVVVELSRGVFRRSDAPPASYPDALAVAYRSPRAVLCCVSAAVVHDLTDEMPAAVQIALPRRSHVPSIDHPPVEVLRFDESHFGVGQSTFEAAPSESVKVYDPPRTVVDLIRLRHRFGEPIAYGALHRYLRSPGGGPRLLLDRADELGVLEPVRAAVDVASAR